LERLYSENKFKDPKTISSDLKVNDYIGEILLPTVRLYLSVMSATNIKVMHFSRQTFPHQLLLYHSKSIRDKNFNKRLIKTFIIMGKV